MSEESEKIVGFLKAKAEAVWAEHRQPYLLSLAGPEMEAEGIDYRTILAGERLKSLVLRTQGEEGGYKILQHPTQVAKLAILPYAAEFRFEDEPQGELLDLEGSSPPDTGRPGSQLLAFLNALSKLPLEDLDGVIIPTRVLVKLARKK